jgi:hypothetical protein
VHCQCVFALSLDPGFDELTFSCIKDGRRRILDAT